jgi:hypothetical protein
MSRLLFWSSLFLLGLTSCSGAKNERQPKKEEQTHSLSPTESGPSDSASQIAPSVDSSKLKKYQENIPDTSVAPDHKAPK